MLTCTAINCTTSSSQFSGGPPADLEAGTIDCGGWKGSVVTTLLTGDSVTTGIPMLYCLGRFSNHVWLNLIQTFINSLPHLESYLHNETRSAVMMAEALMIKYINLCK